MIWQKPNGASLKPCRVAEDAEAPIWRTRALHELSTIDLFSSLRLDRAERAAADAARATVGILDTPGRSASAGPARRRKLRRCSSSPTASWSDPCPFRTCGISDVDSAPRLR